MKNSKSLPVLAQFAYDRIGSFTHCNPFTIAFCYTNPKYKSLGNGEFIIKGGCREVTKYIKSLDIPMLIFETLWYHGQSRCIIDFPNFSTRSVLNKEPYVSSLNLWKIKGEGFFRNKAVYFAGNEWLTFRTFPRKWLPEYDLMLKSRTGVLPS